MDQAVVMKRRGPVPFDPEVFTKGYGLEDKGQHVYLYEIEYVCEDCGGHGPELVPGALIVKTGEAE